MVDERSLEALRRARADDKSSRLTLAQFKMMVREQFFMLLLEPGCSLAAISKPCRQTRMNVAAASAIRESAVGKRGEYPARPPDD